MTDLVMTPGAGVNEDPNGVRQAVTPKTAEPAATDVYAVQGADPEVLAYAMAKYSRSALSMKESLGEISTQRAEQFLNTFYFQYGHRSIADLAHVAFAIERLSLLAAIVLVDEQRWDGQERSTRYQDFLKSGWYTPDFGGDQTTASTYTAAVAHLFDEYTAVSKEMTAALLASVPQPEGMKREAYERTLRARAFDVARYLLPLATNTSLGQIVNARTLEGQVSRLLSHPTGEVRDLGIKLRHAAQQPAWNVTAEEVARMEAELVGAGKSDLAARLKALLRLESPVAPTLVKYAEPQPYRLETRRALKQAAVELLAGVPIAPAPLVDLVEPKETLEAELAATLLYSVSHYSYRQIRDQITALSEARIAELVELGLASRGRHDELLREFSAGQALRFDILMDVGGFRDMHRHRRCVQVVQDFTAVHGYEVPDQADGCGLAAAGLTGRYHAAMTAAYTASAQVGASGAQEAYPSSQYLLPLGTRIRSLFKMDYAEAAYIADLRSAPAGHFSYRQVAWEMYRAVERAHPLLARHWRVTSFEKPIDLFQR